MNANDRDDMGSGDRDGRRRGRIARIVGSFRYAFRGVGFVIQTQTNAWVHAVVTVVVVVLGLLLRVAPLEWCVLSLAIGMVWAFEAGNTAIERLADGLHPDPHPLIGQAKDVGAAAVLLASLAAAAVGVIVFGPRLLALLG